MEKFDCGGNLATSMGAFPRLSHAFPLWQSTPVRYVVSQLPMKSLEKHATALQYITIYYNHYTSTMFNFDLKLEPTYPVTAEHKPCYPVPAVAPGLSWRSAHLHGTRRSSFKTRARMQLWPMASQIR